MRLVRHILEVISISIEAKSRSCKAGAWNLWRLVQEAPQKEIAPLVHVIDLDLFSQRHYSEPMCGHMCVGVGMDRRNKELTKTIKIVVGFDAYIYCAVQSSAVTNPELVGATC